MVLYCYLISDLFQSFREQFLPLFENVSWFNMIYHVMGNKFEDVNPVTEQWVGEQWLSE